MKKFFYSIDSLSPTQFMLPEDMNSEMWVCKCCGQRHADINSPVKQGFILEAATKERAIEILTLLARVNFGKVGGLYKINPSSLIEL